MADFYVSSTRDIWSSSGHAGTLADPMGLQEACSAVTGGGDRVILLADGNYDFTTATAITWGAGISGTHDNPIWVTGANATGDIDGTRANVGPQTLQVQTDTFIVDDGCKYVNWRNLNFYHTHWNGTTSVWGRGYGHTYEDITVDGHTNGSLTHIVYAQPYFVCRRVVVNGGRLAVWVDRGHAVFEDCVFDGVGQPFQVVNWYSNGQISVNRCAFRNCDLPVKVAVYDEISGFILTDCLFENCIEGASIYGFLRADRCTFAGGADSTGNAITVPSGGADKHLNVQNCVFTNWGGYAIDLPVDDADGPLLVERYNNFYGNVSGNISTRSIDVTSTQLDPVYVGGGDYGLGVTSPLRQVEQIWLGGEASYPDLGAFQSAATATSGSGGGHRTVGSPIVRGE